MNEYELTDALETARRMLEERDAEIAELRDLLNQAHAERDNARDALDPTHQRGGLDPLTAQPAK
jgi:hypothetical protein